MNKFRQIFDKKQHLFGLMILSLMICSCSKSLSFNEALLFVEDPKNGLCKTEESNGISYKVVFLPPELTNSLNKSASDGLNYFQLHTSDNKFLFQASEGQFLWKQRGLEIFSSIVIAENLGSQEKNRILIGFPMESFKNGGSLQILGFNKEIVTTFNFSSKALDKIKKITLK